MRETKYQETTQCYDNIILREQYATLPDIYVYDVRVIFFLFTISASWNISRTWCMTIDETFLVHISVPSGKLRASTYAAKPHGLEDTEI